MQFKWDAKFQPEQPHILITYINRGSPGDENTIKYEQILEIEKKFLLIQARGEPTYIPMHRITRVVNSRTDEVLYMKTEKSNWDV